MRIALALLLLGVLGVMSPKPPKEITRAEAQRLLLRALEENHPSWVHLAKFGLDYYRDPYFPGFFFFEADWDNPKGSVVLGHYAVNPKTADLWEAIGCHRLAPGAIKPLQKALRRKLGLSEKEYRRLSKEAPCSPDP